MRQMMGSLMNSRNSLKITQDKSARAFILGVLFRISGADTIKINKSIYELTPEIYNAVIYPTYTGKTMNNENDILMTDNFRKDVGYNGIGDKDSKREMFFTKKLPKLAEEIQNKTFEEKQTTLMIYKEKE